MKLPSSNLEQLLEQNPEIQAYYRNLPDYVRDQIELHAENMVSLDSMQGYVQQIMNGFYR